MRLCPQACPTAGKASYSAQMAIDKGPDPTRAFTAVGRSVGAALHVEAGVGEHVADTLRGADLLEAQLGLAVDGAAELHQCGLELFDGSTRGVLGRRRGGGTLGRSRAACAHAARAHAARAHAARAPDLRLRGLLRAPEPVTRSLRSRRRDPPSRPLPP